MNRAKRKLIDNILTMPDDFSEESILLQLILKDPGEPYVTCGEGISSEGPYGQPFNQKNKSI